MALRFHQRDFCPLRHRRYIQDTTARSWPNPTSNSDFIILDVFWFWPVLSEIRKCYLRLNSKMRWIINCKLDVAAQLLYLLVLCLLRMDNNIFVMLYRLSKPINYGLIMPKLFTEITKKQVFFKYSSHINLSLKIHHNIDILVLLSESHLIWFYHYYTNFM